MILAASNEDAASPFAGGTVKLEPELISAPSDIPSEPTVMCPKCGAPMVKRTATKGQNMGKEFYGCSKFPKCRGIVNIA